MPVRCHYAMILSLVTRCSMMLCFKKEKKPLQSSVRPDSILPGIFIHAEFNAHAFGVASMLVKPCNIDLINVCIAGGTSQESHVFECQIARSVLASSRKSLVEIPSVRTIWDTRAWFRERQGTIWSYVDFLIGSTRHIQTDASVNDRLEDGRFALV